MLCDVVHRCRRWAYAPVIHVASHFYHEKWAAWDSISIHACDPVPIVMGLRLAALRYDYCFLCIALLWLLFLVYSLKLNFFRGLKISGKIFSRRYQLSRDSRESILGAVVCKFILLVFSGGDSLLFLCGISHTESEAAIFFLFTYLFVCQWKWSARHMGVNMGRLGSSILCPFDVSWVAISFFSCCVFTEFEDFSLCTFGSQGKKSFSFLTF